METAAALDDRGCFLAVTRLEYHAGIVIINVKGGNGMELKNIIKRRALLG